MGDYQFTLFIAGQSPRSQQALINLRRLAEARLGNGFELSVVDVLLDPESADAARILTTPTVVRTAPAPARRVTGDLSDASLVVIALDLPTTDQELTS